MCFFVSVWTLHSKTGTFFIKTSKISSSTRLKSLRLRKLVDQFAQLTQPYWVHLDLILLGPSGSYIALWAILSLTGPYLFSFTLAQPYWALLGLTQITYPYLALLGLTQPYLSLLSPTQPYLALLSPTQPYLALLSLTQPY